VAKQPYIGGSIALAMSLRSPFDELCIVEIDPFLDSPFPMLSHNCCRSAENSLARLETCGK
jgi:hypothetical protein